jgi:hypothetical protein
MGLWLKSASIVTTYSVSNSNAFLIPYRKAEPKPLSFLQRPLN